MIHSIRRFGAAVLRRRAESLEPGSDAAREILDDLWVSLNAGTGVGLAAPQIGVSARAFVIRDPEAVEEGPNAGRIDVVNPVLEKTFGPEEDFEEGCLSFPGMYFDVRRPTGAVMHYRDADGNEQMLKDRGLKARIALHELDHLDGVLFIDRVGPGRRLWLAPRLLWVMLTGFVAGLFRKEEACERSDG